MLKQGTKSPGVQRQYTGSAGKVTNCQVAVVLSAANRHDVVPIDAELYLPESWIKDEARRKQARIPDSVRFSSKVDLALAMIERACLDKLPGQILLADSGYGDSHAFREALSMYGLDYAVGIKGQTKVVLIESEDTAPNSIVSVEQLAHDLHEHDYRIYRWRETTSARNLSGRFAFRRVRITHDDGSPLEQRQPLWLLIEHDPDRDKTKLYLTTLPHRMPKAEIVQILKERWRTEQLFQELKGELGFDHFEGRTFPGWHHHVSVVFCCYAFVVSERARLFPPAHLQTRDDQNLRQT